MSSTSRLYALYIDENIPQRTVRALRALGHDVLTLKEDGKAGKRHTRKHRRPKAFLRRLEVIVAVGCLPIHRRASFVAPLRCGRALRRGKRPPLTAEALETRTALAMASGPRIFGLRVPILLLRFGGRPDAANSNVSRNTGQVASCG